MTGANNKKKESLQKKLQKIAHYTQQSKGMRQQRELMGTWKYYDLSGKVLMLLSQWKWVIHEEADERNTLNWVEIENFKNQIKL